MQLPHWTQIVASVVIPLVGAWVTWSVARTGKRGERENVLIDQLQEELGTERDIRTREVGELRSELDSLRLEVRSLRTRDVAWEIFTARQDDLIVRLDGTPLPRPPELQPRQT